MLLSLHLFRMLPSLFHLSQLVSKDSVINYELGGDSNDFDIWIDLH